MTKVMIVGSGAREHALANAYLRESSIEVLVTPGNTGMLYHPGQLDQAREGISIDSRGSLKDPSKTLAVAKWYQPDLIEVAQDDALAAGTVDLLAEHGFFVFGPTRSAARVEWDKGFARNLMRDARVPQPNRYWIFERGEEVAASVAAKMLIQSGVPAFFKAAGLYAGKGVVSASSEEEVPVALDAIGKMGDASKTYLVEEGLPGEEASFTVYASGTDAVFLKSSQDHKKLLDFDRGPNTGGMGAYSPTSITKGIEGIIMDTIVHPILHALAKQGTPYTGVLYVGLMIDDQRQPRVVEINSRPGDPEIQTILPGVLSGYFDLVTAAASDLLANHRVQQDDLVRVSIVGAARGYAEDSNMQKAQVGKRIWLPNSIPHDIAYLSAALDVRQFPDGCGYVVNGGRVDNVIGTGASALEAATRATNFRRHIKVEDDALQWRKDIGKREVIREFMGAKTRTEL